MQVTIEIPDDIVENIRAIKHRTCIVHPEENIGLQLSRLRKCGILVYGESMHTYAFTIVGETIYNQLTQSPPANNKP